MYESKDLETHSSAIRVSAENFCRHLDLSSPSWSAAGPKSVVTQKNDPSKMPHNRFVRLNPYFQYPLLLEVGGGVMYLTSSKGKSVDEMMHGKGQQEIKF